MYFCCIIVYLVFVQPRIVSRMVIFISLFDFVYHCIVVLLSPSCRNCIVGMVIHVMRDMWRKRYFCLMLCLVYIILLIMIIINIKEKKEINNMNIYYSTCVLTDYILKLIFTVFLLALRILNLELIDVVLNNFGRVPHSPLPYIVS